jgi:hypothetical protein
LKIVKAYGDVVMFRNLKVGASASRLRKCTR